MISKRFLPLFLIPFLFFSCNEKNPQTSNQLSEEEIKQKQEEERLLKIEQEKLALQQKKDSAIQKYIDSFSDEVKISQLFLVNIEGNQKFMPIEKTNDGKPLVPGGCLLFSYNIAETSSQTFEFIKSISDFYTKNGNIPPYIAIDQEGGDVNRLRGMTSVLWSQKKVGECFSVENAKKLYSEQAKQMRSLGINMNLAPVVEVENESNSKFLGTRTFGNLEKILSYGKAEIEGFEENGIATVLKHFPANSNVDPHFGLPKIIFDKNDFEKLTKPFEKFVPISSAILMSHAIVMPNEDEHINEFEMPACFSYHWVTEIARNYFCDFKGLIISDDIFMGALAKNGYPPEIAVVEAIKAGVNVIMLSEKRFGSVANVLLQKMKEDELLNKCIFESIKYIIQYKIKAGILELKQTESGDFEVKVIQKGDFDSDLFSSAKKAGMKLYE